MDVIFEPWLWANVNRAGERLISPCKHRVGGEAAFVRGCLSALYWSANDRAATVCYIVKCAAARDGADVRAPDSGFTKRFRLADLFGSRKNRRDLDQLAAVATSLFENVEGGGKHAGHVLACHFDVVAKQGDEGVPVKATDDGLLPLKMG